jgi:hypothetical protein
MTEREHIEWLTTLRYHLRRGPVIVSKRVLRESTDSPDTRNACRALTRTMLPKEVHFVPLPDCERVVLI